MSERICLICTCNMNSTGINKKWILDNVLLSFKTLSPAILDVTLISGLSEETKKWEEANTIIDHDLTNNELLFIYFSLQIKEKCSIQNLGIEVRNDMIILTVSLDKLAFQLFCKDRAAPFLSLWNFIYSMSSSFSVFFGPELDISTAEETDNYENFIKKVSLDWRCWGTANFYKKRDIADLF